ncbi:unnamed protein product [Euphydryas editha]|uniref:Reverse transcriptase domain-containing protein n=1 Tax=Euphydryas editha TaxID=104508 RepID=A0AAU9U3S8_EUPED|nr:unnamed protein product [Euphydryas editha]
MKILQLNLNHCEAAHDLLLQTVREIKPDLVVVSEPYRHLVTQPWVTDKTSKAVIWASGKCPLQSVANSTEAGFVVAKVEGIHFYSCYAPPSLSLDAFEDLLDRLTEDAKQHSLVAIAGDFNSWAVDWGSKETNARGEALLQAMLSLDVVLLNSGNKPTFIRGEASSIVDLTFVSSSLVKGNYSWEVMNTYTASDHCALLWEIPTGQKASRVHKTNAVGWRVGAFDSHTFTVALDNREIGGGNANEQAQLLMKRLTEACDATMPRKCTVNQPPAMYWWNEEICNLRKKCHRTRRASQRGRKGPNYEKLVAEYKSARQKLKKAIKSSKRQCWKELLNEVENDPWGRPYKVVMTHLKNQPMLLLTCPILLNKIVTALFPSQLEMRHPTEQYEEEEIPLITEEELLEACDRVGNAKAPGLDGIPNIALKAAIRAVPSLFLDVYNKCLIEGLFPLKWKQQRLVLLPKGKKPPEEPSSYRPLCMLDTAGKVLERILHRRIEKVVEPLLAGSQYGFRKGRSTLDAIDLVVSTAKEAIAGTRWKGGTKKYCLVATLDIKNAFNSAKWDCIMKALSDMKVPGYLRRMVASYFTDRVLKYDTKTGPKEYRVTGGVPQGSVLGPLLWNIMYDGLLKLNLPAEVKLVAYADDVAVVIVAKHLEEVTFAFDTTVEKIRHWMDTVGLQLAEHKTEAVLITSRKQVETITLQVGAHQIESQPSLRYLGVMIDARLNFKHHVQHVGTKASVVRASLSRLMPNIGGPKQKRRELLASVVTSFFFFFSLGNAFTHPAARRRRVCGTRWHAERARIPH